VVIDNITTVIALTLLAIAAATPNIDAYWQTDVVVESQPCCGSLLLRDYAGTVTGTEKA